MELWLKAIFVMLTIGVIGILVMMAKVSQILNLLLGKDGHL